MSRGTHRPYQHPEDLQLLLAFLPAVRDSETITDFPGLLDLQELLALPEAQNNTHLWFDPHDRLAGFALFIPDPPTLTYDISPAAQAGGAAGDMLRWGIERGIGTASSPDSIVQVGCRDTQRQRIAALEQHGFTRLPEETLHMIRSLSAVIPEPALPPGFAIRPLGGEAEVEAVVDLHRAAFGTQYMTVDLRLSMMRTPGYDPALDLVVAAPDGKLAAYCQCRINPEENDLTGHADGWTDPIATHPRFRRQGLALALLHHGFHLLRQRGMERAILGTSSENLAGQKTFEAAGFRTAHRKFWYGRKLG
jgi:ribosomal protein S18 acetylase RimI-like enzyme